MQITQIENSINQLDGIAFEEMIQALISNQYYFEDGFMAYETGKLPNSQQPSKNQVDIWFSYKRNNTVQYFFVAVTKQKTNVFTKKGKAQRDIKDIIAEVKKTNLSNVTIIFACNQNPSQDDYLFLQQICAKENYRFELWGLNRITSLIQHNPIIAADYLKIVDDSHVLVPLSEYLSRHAHDTELGKAFLHRENEKRELQEKVLETNKSVVIVHGPSGCGKTRLVIEIAKELQSNNGHLCYYFKPLSFESANNALLSLPRDRKVLLIIDDANIYHYLNHFIEIIISESNIAVLMTIRDYLWNDFSKRINFRYHDLALNPLKKSEIEDIVKQAYSVTNKNYLDYLYAISRNNLRFALMATEIFVEKNEKPKSVSDVLENYYGAILKDSEIDRYEDLEKTIVAISLLGRTDIRDVLNNARICELFKIPSDSFYQLCYDAQSKEFVSIFKNAIVEITDQVLAEYLVYKYVFLYKKISLVKVYDSLYKTNRDRIVWFFNALLGIYGFDGIIKSELIELKNYCLNSDIDEKQLVFFQLFSSLFPNECIEFAYKNIIEKEEPFLKDYYHLVLHFANHEKTYQQAANCFIRLIKREQNIQSSTEFIDENFRITIESLNNRFAFEKTFLSQLINFAKERKEVNYCLYKTIKKYYPYETSYSEYEKDTKQVLFKRFIVPYSKEYIELRQLLWDGVCVLIQNACYKEAKDILSCNRIGATEEVKKVRQFDKEQSLIIYNSLDLRERDNLLIAFSLLSPYKQSNDVKEIFNTLRSDDCINLFYMYVYDRTSRNLFGEELINDFKKNYLIKFNNGNDLMHDLIHFYNLFYDEQSWKVGTLVLAAYEYLSERKEPNYDSLVLKFINETNARICFNPYNILCMVKNKKDLLEKIVNGDYPDSELLISQLLLTMKTNEIDDEIYAFAESFYRNRKNITYGNDNVLSLNNFETYKSGFLYNLIKDFVIDNYNYHFVEYAFLDERKVEKNVIELFNNDIGLFRKVYFAVARISQLCDLEGSYLRFLVNKDPDAVNEFFELLFDGKSRFEIRSWLFEINGFVEHFVPFIEKTKFASLNFYIGHVVSKMPDNVLTSFIEFYILRHKDNPYDMQTLSIIIDQREKSGTQTLLFKLLVSHEIPEDTLKKMDLFNGPHSWSGSIVPYIHKNIQEMRDLILQGNLPEQYASYLNKLIERQLKRAEEEEIAEFNRDDY